MQKLSLLGDLIDISHQIELDKKTDRESLRRRDRDIGLLNNGQGADRNPAAPKKLRQWISHVRESQPAASNGRSVERTMRLTVISCWIIGFAVGYLLASATLHYDGTQPVNLLLALAILVGLQILALIVLALLLMLKRTEWLDALSILNPGKLIASLASRFSPNWKHSLNQISRQMGPARMQKLGIGMVVYLAQHFAVAMNIGIISALMVLVTLSDIAFGWNTTLDINSDTVSALLQHLALPWQEFFPHAVPDHTLVESSRYYRLQSHLQSNPVTPKHLGTWWPYLALCVLIYGLIPRLIALMICGTQFDRSVKNSIVEMPGTAKILSRMSDPLVQTISNDHYHDAEDSVTRPGLPSRQAGRTLACPVIHWSDSSATDEDLKKLGIEPLEYFGAGGQFSLQNDRDTASAAASSASDGIVIIAKIWEPPMLEIIDYIEMLRQKTPASLPLIIVLVPLDHPDSSLIKTAERVIQPQVEAWETALGEMKDPSLYVEVL